MSEQLYPLEEAPDEVNAVGGKAASLAHLARAGLPVPPGVALTVDAFETYLRQNSIDPTEELSQDAALARLRAGRWPGALLLQIEAACETIAERSGGAPLAVRSSAPSEDSTATSFAGQHATVLNVRGLDRVLDAVLECWASLYAEEARHYRRARDAGGDDAGMAVVLQALVRSEASGVAFTLDPVSGDHDLVVIEAAFGLGEGVAGGAVTPDHFAVRKRDRRVVRCEVSSKHARVVPCEDGTRLEELPASIADRPSLTDDQAVELAELAARIEDLYGSPQDIEWALADGRLYVLQSRPVTAVAPATADAEPAPLEVWVSEFDTPTHPDTVWTAANVQEVLPDQISPLNLTMTDHIVERFGTQPIERIGVKLKNPDPFSGYFYSRAFLNVSMMLEVADQTPFGSVEAIMEQFFGHTRGDFAVPPKQRTLSRLLRYAVVLPKMVWFSARMPVEIRRAEAVVEDFERDLAHDPFDQRSDEALIAAAEDGLVRGGEVAVTHVSSGGITSSAFEWLRRCTEHWLDDRDGILQSRLVTGLAALESAQPAFELWELSRLVVRSASLRAVFRPADPREVERRLAVLHDPDARSFREALDGFLSRHGYRSVMEAEPSAKSWAEDVPTVLAMVRNYLHADPSAEPSRVAERQRRDREQATRDALRRLRWWQKPLFRYALGQAQQWVASREHTKALMVRTIHRGRLLTRELGRRGVERGLLDDVFDVYYLTWDETKRMLRGLLGRDAARSIVARRREDEARNMSVELPETFRGHPTPIRREDPPLPEGRTLRGIPVSPGRVTGRARVILDPRRGATIEPGEILVAPVTDAGWTPLFIAAAGVVVDIGGSLSHGSTVAREYGLPAVVNVKHGTRVIETGQVVTVDGTKGIVILDARG